ncbi:hypothetical protein QOZ88_19510 [Blastococcus sp. BMG 814]|uniref:Uncharacterized protein n=1 Tax=Blastococcus carthaginiensis TaxID=3050034 RepID=A0ABT9IGZ8_9ACTN|nr:hypothetical protein [Blastococcus carthaginiensis]MDP5184826.1 hypothetical protein [Blastococcus carthaginiensis]
MPASQPPAHERPTGVDAVYLPGALVDRPTKRALNKWQQGDLIREVGLFWAGTEDVDQLTGLAAQPTAGHRWPVVPWDGAPADPLDVSDSADADADAGQPPTSWAIITSQTCDVVAGGPGQRHPTVQVSPLQDITHLAKSKILEIQRGEKVDLVYVPDVPAPGTWAADLRISLPVSKAILLRQERVPGFADPAEAIQFAERVAAKFRRPALHDEITGGLVPGLRALVDQARTAGELWPDLIEQFRLQITDGDRLKPRNVRILAVTLDDLTAQDRQPLREWRTQERKRLLRASNGIVLAPIWFGDLEKVGVGRYRDSDYLRIPELGQPVFW